MLTKINMKGINNFKLQFLIINCSIPYNFFTKKKLKNTSNINFFSINLNRKFKPINISKTTYKSIQLMILLLGSLFFIIGCFPLTRQKYSIEFQFNFLKSLESPYPKEVLYNLKYCNYIYDNYYEYETEYSLIKKNILYKISSLKLPHYKKNSYLIIKNMDENHKRIIEWNKTIKQLSIENLNLNYENILKKQWEIYEEYLFHQYPTDKNQCTEKLKYYYQLKYLQDNYPVVNLSLPLFYEKFFVDKSLRKSIKIHSIKNLNTLLKPTINLDKEKVDNFIKNNKNQENFNDIDYQNIHNIKLIIDSKNLQKKYPIDLQTIMNIEEEIITINWNYLMGCCNIFNKNRSTFTIKNFIKINIKETTIDNINNFLKLLEKYNIDKNLFLKIYGYKVL